MIDTFITSYKYYRKFIKDMDLKKLLFNLGAFAFRLILFSRNEYVTIMIALSSKRKKSLIWYGNNFFIPIVVIYSPYLLTLVSSHFHKILFSKSLLELSITGGLTLLGINVMRTSLSLINEKIDESKIPINILKEVNEDIESIKSKLRLWTHFLTFIGGIFYIMQVGMFLNINVPVIKWYVFLFFGITVFSIYISRLIVVIQSNFVDNDKLIEIWMKLLNHDSEKEYSTLKNIATKEGL